MESKHCKAEQICYAIIVHLPKGNVPLLLQLTIAKALTSISKQHCVNNNLGLDLKHKKRAYSFELGMNQAWTFSVDLRFLWKVHTFLLKTFW